MQGFLTEGVFAEIVRLLQDERRTGRLRFTTIEDQDGRPRVGRHTLVLHEGRVAGVEGDSPLPAGADSDPTALLLHSALALTEVLTWRDGTYAFEVEESDGAPAVTGPTLEASACSAVTAVRDVAAVRRALGPTTGHFRAARQPSLNDDTALLPVDAFVLTRLCDVRSAPEVAALLPDPDDAPAVLLRLKLAGLLQVAEPPREAPRPPRAAAPPPPAAAPAPAVAAAAKVPAPPAAPANVATSDRLPVGALREDIQRAHAALPEATLFQVLGLSREASLDDVRQSYRTLVRRYHPDGYSDPRIVDLRDKAVALFVAVGEAYAVLSDPGRRTDYEQETARREYREALRARAAADGVVSDIHDAAAAHLDRAAEALALGQTAEAMRILDGVLPTLTPADRVRGQVLLGRAYMGDPVRARDAEKVLQDALRDEPGCVAAQLGLAALYRQRGLRNRARRMYRLVQDAEPGNLEAGRELLRMDEEDAPAPAEAPKPLFARLFRPRN